jgi:hypothetical protein
MIIAVGILAFVAVCVLSLVGMGESHNRVSKILTELDDQRIDQETPTQAPAIESQAPKIDVFAEVGFTRSLLALGKVGSQDPYGSPKPALAESSSLVSVHLPQSKNHAPVL